MLSLQWLSRSRNLKIRAFCFCFFHSHVVTLAYIPVSIQFDLGAAPDGKHQADDGLFLVTFHAQDDTLLGVLSPARTHHHQVTVTHDATQRGLQLNRLSTTNHNASYQLDFFLLLNGVSIAFNTWGKTVILKTRNSGQRRGSNRLWKSPSVTVILHDSVGCSQVCTYVHNIILFVG